MMKTGAEGLALIKKWEGLRLRAYYCPAGVLTIGYGDTRNVKEGMVITQAEADERLVKRLEEFERGVWGGLTPSRQETITQNEFDALVSFAYNVGGGAWMRSTLRRAVNKDAPCSEVRANFMRWVRAGGKILRGLRERRADEAALYCRK